MVQNNGFTTTPHHRQNRRRERPGSRTRRTITRKAAVQCEYAEGLLDAFDIDVRLPSDNSRPSPLLRQSYDQVWQRWKARQAEEKALAVAEMERLQVELEQEQLKLFGGEVDEDELYRLGILYDGENADTRNPLAQSTSSSVVGTSTPTPPPPLYILRQAKPRRSRRRLTWVPIPLFLSLSNLQDDNDIARFLSPPTTTTTPMIQHQPKTCPIPEETPLSLPSTSASALASSAHGSQLDFLTDNTPDISNSILSHSLPLEDWTFVTSDSTHFTPALDSPASEPETWILLSDDS